MRKIIIYILFITFVFGNISCTRVMMLAYGVHMPRQESKLDLLNYLERKKMRVDNVLFVKSENDWGKLGKYGVEIICFDKNNNFYWYKDTSQCNAPAFIYCENICNTAIPENRVSTSFKLDSLLSMTEDFLGNTPTASTADYTVIIGWAKWNGRLNVDHVKVWEEALQKSGCKIKVYKLCLDPLKQWGKPTYSISNKTISTRRNNKSEVLN